jgi:hypothetical protein
MRTSRVILGTLIAFVVSVLCLLPPGVHFVTGPIGPVIGGYVAGNRLRLSSAEALVVGVAMGVAIGATSILAFEYLEFMPNLAPQASIPLSVIGALYVGALGALGSWVGSRGH